MQKKIVLLKSIDLFRYSHVNRLFNCVHDLKSYGCLINLEQTKNIENFLLHSKF